MLKDRIKELRTQNNLTISAFAKSLGISPTSASLYESGKQNPGKKTIAKICDVYGVDEAWLMEDAPVVTGPETKIIGDITKEADEPAVAPGDDKPTVATATVPADAKPTEEKKRGRKAKKTDAPVVDTEEKADASEAEEKKPEQNIDKAAVLARVKEIGVRKAAEEVGVAWQTVNKWRKEAPPLVEPSEIRILQGTKRRKYPPKKKEEKKPEEKKEDVVVAAEVIEKKTKIIIQSPLGGNITPRQVLQKIPDGSDSVYIRVDENKLYWVKGDESGAVDIWG